ncbi:hypothetical protein E5C31_13090 [Providencia rettgeri]|nr:hypothetical protein [Providencia rettgeri]
MRTPYVILLAGVVSGCAGFGGNDQIDRRVAAIQVECLAKWESHNFDLIRGKLEYRPTQSGPERSPELATSEERLKIAQFSELYDDCQSRQANVLYVSSPSVGMRSIRQTNAELRELRKLQQGKITWDQFTERRYSIINNRGAEQTAEDQRRHSDYMQQQQEQQQNRLERAAQSQPRITTTNCNADGVGGYNCTSQQQ